MSDSTDNLDETLKRAANQFYSLEGECTPELYRAISTLRQLINEEYIGQDRMVRNQLIFDILHPAIEQYGYEREIERLNSIKIGLLVYTAKHDIPMRDVAVNIIEAHIASLERSKEQRSKT